MLSRPVTGAVAMSLVVLVVLCPSANAQTTTTNQASSVIQTVTEHFIGQLLAAELQTVFQQADTYIASSLFSRLGGTGTSQTALTGGDFGEQLSAALLKTFFQQLDTLIAQLPTLFTLSNIFSQTSQ
jgi:hypothetical protein